MARGRWLHKVADRAKEKIANVKEVVENHRSNKGKKDSGNDDGSSSSSVVENLMSNANRALGKMDSTRLGATVRNIQERAASCNKLATETTELCATTQTKSRQMIELSTEVQTSLEGFQRSGIDASALETIRDLTDGKKLEQARDIVKDMDLVAIGCIEKAVQMIDLMEDAMDHMPDVLHDWIDKVAAKQQRDSDDTTIQDLKTLDKDIDDVNACIQAMQELNLATAFKIGLQAFEQLSAKSLRSQAMLNSIQKYSTNVRSITDDFVKMDVVSLAKKIPDILKCLRLSEVMRAVAEGVKRTLQALMDLFKATSERISTLWAALAFAKDCMAACVQDVMDGKQLVSEAHAKSLSLLRKSQSVLGQLQSVRSMNRQTFSTVRELSQGDEIPDAIDLAMGMDDLMVECNSKVTNMVDRVRDGFEKLPPILTAGFEDIEQVGKNDKDPKPREVADDVVELRTAQVAIERSNIFTACQSGAAGFLSVSKKTEICSEMLVSLRDFATNCDTTIDSFMNVWDIESATTKIKDMCRLVSLGEIMKEISRHLKDLLLAIAALLKSALARLSTLDMRDLAGQVDDLVGNAVGNIMGDQVGGFVGDKVDQVVGKLTSNFTNLFKK